MDEESGAKRWGQLAQGEEGKYRTISTKIVFVGSVETGNSRNEKREEDAVRRQPRRNLLWESSEDKAQPWCADGEKGNQRPGLRPFWALNSRQRGKEFFTRDSEGKGGTMDRGGWAGSSGIRGHLEGEGGERESGIKSRTL